MSRKSRVLRTELEMQREKKSQEKKGAIIVTWREKNRQLKVMEAKGGEKGHTQTEHH